MSTLADVNAAVAAYQATDADVNAFVPTFLATQAAVDEATTTGQANIDAAISARDATVSAAQVAASEARVTLDGLMVLNAVQYELVFVALRAYVP